MTNLTPYQKSKRFIICSFAFVVLIVAVIASAYFYLNKDKVIRHDKVTGTKYVECKKWDEARFKDGTVMYAGNCNSEYENGVIG